MATKPRPKRKLINAIVWALRLPGVAAIWLGIWLGRNDIGLVGVGCFAVSEAMFYFAKRQERDDKESQINAKYNGKLP